MLAGFDGLIFANKKAPIHGAFLVKRLLIKQRFAYVT
jgi:hypothetical protein